ncbi:hypothetical protein A3Q37_06892 [Streptomyces sp. PTY087I2]|nr:hypothetical protein A3Q37_06892 [Streptomyces sp. PTY087I2]
MLPRQRRRRGCTGSARRKSMRPWQRPDVVFTATTATELLVPGVATVGPYGPRAAPARSPRKGRGRRRPETASISGHSRIVGQTLTGPSLFGHSLEVPPYAHTVPRPPGDPSTHSPGGGPHLPDRSAARGEWSGGFPQPTESSAAGRPTQDSAKRPATGGARAHGRAHGHTPGARPTPARTPRPGHPDRPHGQQSRHPDVCPLTVGIGRTTLCLLVFSTGGHIPRGSATCVCRRSTRVRTWGGIGTNAARRPR